MEALRSDQQFLRARRVHFDLRPCALNASYWSANRLHAFGQRRIRFGKAIEDVREIGQPMPQGQSRLSELGDVASNFTAVVQSEIFVAGAQDPQQRYRSSPAAGVMNLTPSGLFRIKFPTDTVRRGADVMTLPTRRKSVHLSFFGPSLAPSNGRITALGRSLAIITTTAVATNAVRSASDNRPIEFRAFVRHGQLL